MSWPDATREPVSRLSVRSKAVVLVTDDFTGQPPAVVPAMRLQQLHGDAVTELDWRPTVTLGGAMVFGVLDDLGSTPDAERYRLLVDADDALRPDQPDGYALDVPADPARWPVQVEVSLLPGPGYAFTPHLPVVRGLVLEPGPGLQPVANAVVAASEDGGGTVSARCGADHRAASASGCRPTVPRERL